MEPLVSVERSSLKMLLLCVLLRETCQAEALTMECAK